MDTEMGDFERNEDDRRREGSRTGPHKNTFDRLAESFVGYLRTRTSEHWVMFMAGLVIGSVVG